MDYVSGLTREQREFSMRFVLNFLKHYLSNYIDIPRASWRVIPLIFLESLVMSVSFFIAVFFTKSLEFSTQIVGNLISMMMFGTFAGAILSGYLTIRILPSKITAFGFLLVSLSFLSLSISRDIFVLMPVMFLLGVGSVFMMIANLTALVRTATDDKSKNQLIVLQGVIFNITVSITGFLFSYLHPSNFYLLFKLLSIMLILSGLYLFKQKIVIPSKQTIDKKRSKIHWDLALLVVPSVFFYGLVFSVVKVFYAIDIQQKFDAPLLQSMMLSANPFMVIFIQPLLVSFIKKNDGLEYMTLGAILISVGYILFGFSKGLLPVLTLIMIATIGEMIFSPLSKKYASSMYGEGFEGMGLATWKLVYYLSGIIGASLSGTLGANYGHSYAWSMCGMLGLISLLVFVIYGRRIKSDNLNRAC
jgi:predicted MFS family arabinose efflux permease